jgi:D-alanyl-D-alanine carboxypeptidase
MSVKKSTTAVIMTAAAFCATASAESVKVAERAVLQKCVADEVAKTPFSGVVLITSPDGAIVHTQGLMSGPGSANIAPDAQFNLGSASKMWTAVAVAQLVDAKKVSLGDPIGRYVTGLTPEVAAVTIRQLLTHSGGLGNFFRPENLSLLQKAQSHSELKPLITAEKPEFTPGSRFRYSNSGFLLLGLMVEQVSGQPFGRYLDAYIFAPSGMTVSGMMPASPSTRAVGMTNVPEMSPHVSERAAGSMSVQAGPPPGPPPAPNSLAFAPPGPLRPALESAIPGTSGGGGYSTAQDMQRFFTALLAGKLTSIAMRDMLTSPQIEALPAKAPLPALSYGLGFGMGDYNGHRWIGHNGATLGANVETITFPDDQISVIIMANRDPPIAGALMRTLQPKLLGGAACAIGQRAS